MIPLPAALTADPPTTDDRNHWVAGMCWLYCRRSGIQVLWIGPAHAPGGTAPMFACVDCIYELARMVEQHNAQRYGC